MAIADLTMNIVERGELRCVHKQTDVVKSIKRTRIVRRLSTYPFRKYYDRHTNTLCIVTLKQYKINLLKQYGCNKLTSFIWIYFYERKQINVYAITHNQEKQPIYMCSIITLYCITLYLGPNNIKDTWILKIS